MKLQKQKHSMKKKGAELLSQDTQKMMLHMVLLTCWRPVQCLCNINHVDNDRLDSIPFAFNLDETKTEYRPSTPEPKLLEEENESLHTGFHI